MTKTQMVKELEQQIVSDNATYFMLENQQSRAFLKSTPYNNTSASTKPNGHTVLENHCRGEDFTKNYRFLSDESQFCQKYTDENSRQNA